ncbi:hypothetical protein HF669_06485 [Acidithiobacillus thiooxidans]|uniref:hypothetical protein n=1 Tax=Acidithiobacillus thiooxidans TaxID=930 RepID=UPI00026254CF|nr:hypothetical protein [Acidithiobacillus thiooxidans]MBU2793371.1 hypothetical protein [Acidithiobacillus thiooxidans]MBU2811030.1 hypothetical protein [Acidithiobacillus thiooxidans]
MKAGDIVYGPYPYQAITDRRKMNHYCFVLDVNEEQMLVAAETSSHIDSCNEEYEFLVEDDSDLKKLHLSKTTRFNMTETSEVKVSDFDVVANIQECQNLMPKLWRALRAAGHI